MLSIENPPSPVPSCPCSSQLIKSSDSNLCGGEKGPLKLKVDLSDSGFDDETIKLLSDFSIRDYVLSTRGKDIVTHWPFSPRKLQLCLKHGVKDVLPPFETLECVRVNSIPADIIVEDSNTNRISVSPSNDRRKLPSDKVVSYTQNKRRGMLVKLSNLAVADTMSLKLCPVCKNFSSSSNTTLNAHIDQCLSGGPMRNGMTDSKAIKHRIKPRKTRLMADIYVTALRCTLEDLDRRNGTNWASNSGQAHCLEANLSARAKDDDEKNEPFSSMKFGDKDVEGSVYVDSTGTKLRILSQFSDLPSNDNSVDDCSTMKLGKVDKGTKFLSRRKRCLVQNLKPSSHAEIPDDDCHKTADGDQRNGSSKKGCKKLIPKHCIEPCDQMKTDDFGVVKQWGGTKRTTRKEEVKKRKDNLGHENRHISITMKNLRVKTGLSQVRDTFGKGTIESCSPLSAESLKRKRNLSFHSHNEHMEPPRMRMRNEINDDLMHSTYKARDKGRSSALIKCLKDLRNDTDVSFGLKADVSLTRSRMSKHQMLSPRTKDFGAQKNSSSNHKVKNFSSFQKNLSSGKHQNKTIGIKRLVGLRKRKLCYVSDSDNEAIDLVGSSTENAYHGELPPNSRYNVRNADFCEDNDVTAGASNTSDEVNEVQIQIREDLAHRAITASDDSLDPALPHIPRPSYTDCVPQHYVKAGDEVTEAGLLLQGEQETIFTDSDRELVLLETDADEGHGSNYADIDHIPIPGPPGSFLPSPRHMGSDELQGISSLTTCWLPSSEDEQADSPVSETSMVHHKGHVSHYESPSPSMANQVLRLMGKNLIVVNKEENPPPQTSSISANSNERTVLQSSDNDASKVNVHNQHLPFGGPSILKNSQSYNPTQHIENDASNGFRMSGGFTTQRQSFNGHYKSSFESREYSVGFNNPNEPEKVETRVRARPKEVTVIDDSAELDAMNLSHAKPVHHQGGGVLAPNSSVLRHYVRNANASLICQTQDRRPYSGTVQLVYQHFPASSPLPGHLLSSSSLCFYAGFPLHKNLQ